jgi:hypothetical protein
MKLKIVERLGMRVERKTPELVAPFHNRRPLQTLNPQPSAARQAAAKQSQLTLSTLN